MTEIKNTASMDWLNAIPIVGDIIGGIGNLISGNKANDTNLKIAREATKAQFDMAKWQNAVNIENWNTANRYNSPKAQLQRLKEAGLNPHLVYGSGVTGNSASNIAPAPSADVKTATVQPLDFSFVGNAGRGYLNAKALENTIRKTDSDIELQKTQSVAMMADAAKKRSEMVLNTLRSYGTSLDNRQKSGLLKYNLKMGELGVKQAVEDLQKTKDYNKREGLRIAHARLQNYLIYEGVVKTHVEAEKLSKEIRKVAQEIVNLQTVNKGQEMDNAFKSDTYDDRLYQVELDLSESIARTNGMKQENRIKYLEADWREKYGFSNDQMSSVAKSLVHVVGRTVEFMGGPKYYK